MKVNCCICGKPIKNQIRDSNNPDPLKDENGNWLSHNDGRCCTDCDRAYVLPYRISFHFGQMDQCEAIQQRVIELRKGWKK